MVIFAASIALQEGEPAMNLMLHILQWIVSLIGVLSLCFLLFKAMQSLVLLVWKERGVRNGIVIFVACGLMAATFQRLRIGFWDWPDVDYKIEDQRDGSGNK